MRLPPLTLEIEVERFPVAGGGFAISRGHRTEAVVIVARVGDGACFGRGECVPYARYGETVEGVAATVADQADWLRSAVRHDDLASRMPPGAARNAIDCALWDFRAKTAGARVWDLLGIEPPRPAITCYTLSLGSPEAMEQAARAAAHRPLLKIKLGGAGDPERIAAARRGAPDARLVVDANEAWTAATLSANIEACARAGVELIEQPLPAADDSALAGLRSPIPICADESVHVLAGLEAVAGRYQAINIKLDKSGGLTEALAMLAAARAMNLQVMAGCMVGTSLAMAPAVLLANGATHVDLDGPLLLAADRAPALRYEGSTLFAPDAELWG